MLATRDPNDCPLDLALYTVSLMNLFAQIHDVVLQGLQTLTQNGTLPAGLSFANVAVEPPRDAAHGDMATNAAMVLAKPAKMSPRDIAAALAEQLLTDARITSADVAGPGFLNLRLAPSVWAEIIPAAIGAGTAFGQSTQGQGKRINVEFVSANPTGPLHVGHSRGAVFGDALSSLLDFAGFDVTREYYINDGGSQVDTLARSAFLRYLEANGQDVEFVDGTYPGDYLIPIGEALKARYGDSLVGVNDESWLPEIREFATKEMMALVEADLAALGIKFDKFYSEKSLYSTGRIEAAIEDLRGKGLIYDGTLEPPKGQR